MKSLIILLLLVFLFLSSPSSALAWNGAGHMTIGAIAYQELKREDPTAIDRGVCVASEPKTTLSCPV